MGPIPGQGTKISHAVLYGRRKERKRKKEGRKERKKEKERKEGGRKRDNLFQGTSPWQDAGKKGCSVDTGTQISCPNRMRSIVCGGHDPSSLPFLKSLEARAVCVCVCVVCRGCRGCWG